MKSAPPALGMTAHSCSLKTHPVWWMQQTLFIYEAASTDSDGHSTTAEPSGWNLLLRFNFTEALGFCKITFCASSFKAFLRNVFLKFKSMGSSCQLSRLQLLMDSRHKFHTFLSYLKTNDGKASASSLHVETQTNQYIYIAVIKSKHHLEQSQLRNMLGSFKKAVFFVAAASSSHLYVFSFIKTLFSLTKLNKYLYRESFKSPNQNVIWKESLKRICSIANICLSGSLHKPLINIYIVLAQKNEVLQSHWVQ